MTLYEWNYAVTVDAFMEAAQWASHDDRDPHWDNREWADGERDKAQAAVHAFIGANAADCAQYVETVPMTTGYGGAEMLGHDLWLTSEHHGAGFWDRGLGELGDRLTQAADEMPGAEGGVYVGDDERLYFGTL